MSGKPPSGAAKRRDKKRKALEAAGEKCSKLTSLFAPSTTTHQQPFTAPEQPSTTPHQSPTGPEQSSEQSHDTSTATQQSATPPEQSHDTSTAPQQSATPPEQSHDTSTAPQQSATPPEQSHDTSTVPQQSATPPEQSHDTFTAPQQSATPPEQSHDTSTAPQQSATPPEQSHDTSTASQQSPTAPEQSNDTSTAPQHSPTAPEQSHDTSTAPQQSPTAPEQSNDTSTAPQQSPTAPEQSTDTPTAHQQTHTISTSTTTTSNITSSTTTSIVASTISITASTTISTTTSSTTSSTITTTFPLQSSTATPRDPQQFSMMAPQALLAAPDQSSEMSPQISQLDSPVQSSSTAALDRGAPKRRGKKRKALEAAGEKCAKLTSLFAPSTTTPQQPSTAPQQSPTAPEQFPEQSNDTSTAPQQSPTAPEQSNDTPTAPQQSSDMSPQISQLDSPVQSSSTAALDQSSDMSPQLDTPDQSSSTIALDQSEIAPQLDSPAQSGQSSTAAHHQSSAHQSQPSSVSHLNFDIGNVDFSSLLSDDLKFKILTDKFKPPTTNWKGTKAQFGKKKRRVPKSVFSSKFLSYSEQTDTVFCAPCSVFAKQSCLLVREGQSDWSNIDRHLIKHTRTPSHVHACEMAREFIDVCERNKQSMREVISTKYQEKVELNRAALTSITKTVILCGRQNLALRGSNDDKSNFINILRYRAEVDEKLRTHLKTAPKNATYVGHRTQNELVKLCGEQILKPIIEEIKKAPYFSILVDETTDISVIEQVTFVILFVDELGNRREEFIGFQETANTTGETLYKLILEKLTEFGLDVNKVVGLGFDGASNMSGKVKGVRGRFSAEHPLAAYVHCRSHSLNLAIVHTIRNMYGVVAEIVNFIGASAKRLDLYFTNNPDAGRLKKFCATRWASHEETLHTFIDNLENVYETLEILSKDPDSKTSAKANSMLHSIDNFKFFVVLHIVAHYLTYTKPLSSSLQAVKCDLVAATNTSKHIVDFLRKCRDDNTFETVYRKAKDKAEHFKIAEEKPRTTGRQTKRANAGGSDITVSEYFRLNIHLTFLDHLITELSERLLNVTDRVKAELLLPSSVQSMSHADWACIKTTYAPFIDDGVDAELDIWRLKCSKEDDKTNSQIELGQAVAMTRDNYPNLHRILLVLMTMPVSTASAERSFSVLRRLKTYLRSTMGSDRLDGLALMHVHRDVNIDPVEVIHNYDKSGHRRIVLSFCD